MKEILLLNMDHVLFQLSTLFSKRKKILKELTV